MKFQAVVMLAENSGEKIILKSSHLPIVGIKEGEKRKKGGISSKGLLRQPIKRDSKAGF
jgi:hypothetical protein